MGVALADGDQVGAGLFHVEDRAAAEQLVAAHPAPGDPAGAAGHPGHPPLVPRQEGHQPVALAVVLVLEDDALG